MPDNRDITIRLIRPTDKEAWKTLWRRYLSFYSTIRDEALYESTFRRLADSDYLPMFAYVAETGGKLIGLVNCIVHDHGWYQDQVIFLQDLYVDEAFRGQGAGRRLIEQVYQHADDHRLSGVYWLTQSGNYTAMQLYDNIAIKTDFIKYQR